MKTTIEHGHFCNMFNSYTIYKERDCYALYINGEFYCSGDSRREIEDELDEYLKEKGLMACLVN